MRASRSATVCKVATARLAGILAAGTMLVPGIGMAADAVSDCVYALNGRLALGTPQCITEDNTDADGSGGVLTTRLSIPHVGGLNWTVLPAYLKEKTSDSFSDSIDASVTLGTLSDDITLTLLSGGTAPAGYSPAKALAETGNWINITFNLFPKLDTDKSHLTIWVYSDLESSHVMPLPLPVPEPDTWALFVAGLLALALSGPGRRTARQD